MTLWTGVWSECPEKHGGWWLPQRQCVGAVTVNQKEREREKEVSRQFASTRPGMSIALALPAAAWLHSTAHSTNAVLFRTAIPTLSAD